MDARSRYPSLLLALLIARAGIAAPDPAVVKTVDNETPGPGEPVEFTITITNLGDQTAEDAEVIDRLPHGLDIPPGMAAAPSTGNYDPDTGQWAVGDLGVGESQSLIIPAVYTGAGLSPCIVNEASLPFLVVDSDRTNNRDVAALRRSAGDVCVDLGAGYGLTSSRPFCGTERNAEFDVVVSNHGADIANNVDVTVTLTPPVPNLRFDDARCAGPGTATCSLAELGPGEITLLAVSDRFTNPNASNATVSVSVTTSDPDFQSANDNFTTQTTIPEFFPCGDDPFGVASNSGCFIATAAYGSALHPHLEILRGFRDRRLLTNAPGRAFVDFYYRHSPAAAATIADNDGLRALARALLAPAVIAIVYPWRTLMVLALVLVALSVRARRRKPGLNG